jgi:hypothetical protein
VRGSNLAAPHNADSPSNLFGSAGTPVLPLRDYTLDPVEVHAISPGGPRPLDQGPRAGGFSGSGNQTGRLNGWPGCTILRRNPPFHIYGIFFRLLAGQRLWP